MSDGVAGARRGALAEQALAAMRHEVVSGRFRHSDMLPGERDLSEAFGVSRTTIRRVVTSLVDEGLLTHRQGVGTFLKAAAPLSTPPPGDHLRGFEEDMRARGLSPSSRDLERTIALPGPEEILMLACPPGASVVRLSRIRYADDTPVAIQHAAVPRAFVDDPGQIGTSLYAALERRGFRPFRAIQHLQAIIIGDDDAARLEVPQRSAALYVRRTTYLSDGRCCAFTRSIYRPDRFDGVSELCATEQVSPHRTI